MEEINVEIVENDNEINVDFTDLNTVVDRAFLEHNSNQSAHPNVRTLLNLKANNADVETSLALKADIATTYTKVETDNLLDKKEPKKTSDSYYINGSQLAILGNTSGENTGDETISTIMTKLLNHLHYDTKQFIQASAARILTIKANTACTLSVNGVNRLFYLTSDTNYNFANILDTGSIQAGKDYCIYLVPDDTSGVLVKASLNSTYPNGYTAGNSRKIGGFHTLCTSVGTISGHTLSGYTAGDILPQSIWCLAHRPISAPNGMIYVPECGIWADIYLQSGIGSSTLSIYGATITTTRAWADHQADLLAVSKRMPTDYEFSALACGSNQKTTIYGSTAPTPKNTGGHSDTASRRMISNYGAEDCCGYIYQLLDESAPAGGEGWSVYDGQSGNYGQVYGICYTLWAGGYWGDSSNCGSRCRSASVVRSYASMGAGCRGISRSLSLV